MKEYPEHEKLANVREQSQAIGEFLDFYCAERGYVLCEIPDEYDHTYVPIHRSIESLLADFFEIDQTKLEQEKRRMLVELRK